MSELASEALERHHHLEHNPDDTNARRSAILIGVLAAVLAVSEMAGRSSQNAYLANYIGASDAYAFYQARQTRALVLTQSAVTLGLLPPTPETEKAVASAKLEASRLVEDSDRGNGGKQVLARAAAQAEVREAALHRYEWYEIVTSVLQISIVLASVSVVTRIAPVSWIGAGMGVLAAGLAVLVATGLV